MTNLNIEQFKVWHFQVLKAFSVAEGIGFTKLVDVVNAHLTQKVVNEAIRVFANRLTDSGYLKKEYIKGDAVYIKTAKMDELYKRIAEFIKV